MINLSDFINESLILEAEKINFGWNWGYVRDKWLEKSPFELIKGYGPRGSINLVEIYNDYKKGYAGRPAYTWSDTSSKGARVILFDGHGNCYYIYFKGENHPGSRTSNSDYASLDSIVKFSENDITKNFKISDVKVRGNDEKKWLLDLFIIKKTGGKQTREEVNAAKAPREIKPKQVAPEGIPSKQDELINILSSKGLECIDNQTGNYWDIDDHDPEKFGRDSVLPEIGFASKFAEAASRSGKKCYAIFTEKGSKPRSPLFIYLGGSKIYCINSKETRGKMVLSEWSNIYNIVDGKAKPELLGGTNKRYDTSEILKNDILPNL